MLTVTPVTQLRADREELREYLDAMSRALLMAGLTPSHLILHGLPFPPSPVARVKEASPMIRTLTALPLYLLRKTLSVTVPLLASLLVAHLLTPGLGWGGRALTALGTAAGDVQSAASWAAGTGTSVARYWDPAPTEAGLRLAEHVRSGDGWKCLDAKQAKFTVGGSTAMTLDLANNQVTVVGEVTHQHWALTPGDVTVLTAALKDRYADQQAADHRSAVRAVTDRLAAKSEGTPAAEDKTRLAVVKLLK